MDLAAFSSKTVLELQKDGDPNEGALVQGAVMKFYRMPMTTRELPTSENLALFLKFVDDPVNQSVYVHCAGGRDRTGFMTAANRMTCDGWTTDQAFREMKQDLFGADFLPPEFKKFV